MKCYSAKFKGDPNVIVSNYSPREVGEREVYSEWAEIPEKFIPADFAGRVELLRELSALTIWDGSVVCRPSTKGGAFRVWLAKFAYPARLHDLQPLLEVASEHGFDTAIHHTNNLAKDRRLQAYKRHGLRMEKIVARISALCPDRVQKLLDIEGDYIKFLSGEWRVYVDPWDIIREINKVNPAVRDEVQRLLLEYDGFFTVAD